MIKAVIFDMDGVIVDSEPVYGKWLELFLKENQVSVSDREKKSLPGISTQAFQKKLECWWENAGKPFLSGGEIDKMYDKFCDQFAISYKSIVNPGVEETMELLKNLGYRIAVASSSPMDHINSVLKETELMEYVEVVVSGEMFRHSKPDPEIYNFTVSKLGLKKEECIAVEDSTYGIQAANCAGLKVIAKKDKRFDFNQNPADYHIDTMIQVLDILDDIGAL